MSILILHEDPKYRASLASILEGASMLTDHAYQVTQCAEAGEMLQRLRSEAFDLLILDLCPDCSERSASLLAEVRRARAAQPVLVVTENACLETALDALHYKVQDYLEKSIPDEVLLGRIHEILNELQIETSRKVILDQMQAILDNFRAINPAHASRQPFAGRAGVTKERVLPDPCLQRGDFSANLTTHELFWKGKPIDLSPAEFSYWVVLLRHEPNVITHKALVMEAQGYDLGGREAMNLARWHIHMLRQSLHKALEKELGDNPIQTIRGVGYRLMI